MFPDCIGLLQLLPVTADKARAMSAGLPLANVVTCCDLSHPFWVFYLIVVYNYAYIGLFG